MSEKKTPDKATVYCVQAAYVMGGWQRDVTAQGLQEAVTLGLKASPVAEVRVTIVHEPMR